MQDQIFNKLAALGLILFAFLASPSFANPNFEDPSFEDQSIAMTTAAEGDRWSAHDAASTMEVDHRPLTQILTLINVKERNKVKLAYSRLSGRALDYVKAYISLLESVPVSKLNRNEQLAYWLNLHNISVIKLIAEQRNGHKKVKSYRRTPASPGKLWLEKGITVEGQALSLQDIEQTILLKQWSDPDTLYGIFYGVQGSSAIGKTAFSGATVNARLDTLAKDFINSERHVQSKRKGLEISSIYDWNKALVFNGEDAAILAHLREHAEPRLRSRLASSPKIAKYRFNWKSIAFIPRSDPTSLGGGAGGIRGAGS